MNTIVSVVARTAAVAAFALSPLYATAEEAHEKHKDSQATASFGRGLNTAQPGNPVNHVVLPKEIRIKAGGVVDFAVAGFHDIVIFKPGVALEDLIQAGGGQYPSTPPAFVIPPNPAVALPAAIAFLADSIFYRGINPAGGPLQTVVTGNPANGSNRLEPVGAVRWIARNDGLQRPSRRIDAAIEDAVGKERNRGRQCHSWIGRNNERRRCRRVLPAARLNQIFQGHARLENDDIVKARHCEVDHTTGLDPDLFGQDDVIDRIAGLGCVQATSK